MKRRKARKTQATERRPTKATTLLPPRAAEIAAHWWGPAAITVAALVMLCWTWGTWPDIMIDFGAQLYIPWQLSEGKVLYRDIAYFGGPLSQYFNAAVFSVFGVGLWKLIACNLCILVGLILLLRLMLCQVAARWVADVACLVFVLMFAFAQPTNTGGYNYVCPYTHESTHGLVLLLAALAAVWQYTRWGWAAMAMAGASTGLAFLTKSEVFLGGAAAVVAAILLTIWHESLDTRKATAMVAVFLLCAAVPPLVAFLLLWTAMPASEALVGTLGSWVVATNSEVRNLRFFRIVMGTDDLAASLREIGLGCFWYAVVLGSAAIVALLAGRFSLLRWPVAVCAFAVAAVLLAYRRTSVDWDNAARPFPLVLLVCGVWLAVMLFRAPRGDAATAWRIRQISLVIFALGLLAKMLLNTRTFHYGFVLAMPAMMVIVVALLDWVPKAIHRWGGMGVAFAAAMLGLLVFVLGGQLNVQSRLMDTLTCRVASGADEFWSDTRGVYVNTMLGRLEELAGPLDTLTALPEGIMLNYLSRRVNPTRYTNYMPTEVYLFGEEAMIADFDAHLPNWLMLIEKDTSNFGLRYFGLDYAQGMRGPIERNYQAADAIGDTPFSGGQFGMLLMRRVPAAE